jgi:hypothetical protein
MPRLIAAAVLIALALPAPAQVAFFAHDDPRGTLANSTAARNAFLAALPANGTDTIEGYAAFTPDPTLTFGTTGVTAQTNVDFVAGFAALAVSGNNLLLDRADGGDVFTLSIHVNGFGAFITQAGDGAAANTISYLLENTTLGTSKTVVGGTIGPNATFDNVFFFGVTDTDPFNRVTILETNDAADGILFDDVTIGAVPEPGSLALVGATVLGYVVRRRSRGERGASAP